MAEPKETYPPKNLETILNFLASLDGSTFTSRLPLTMENNDVNQLSNGLNKLVQLLENNQKMQLENARRLDTITEIILGYTVGDFSKKAAVSKKGDEIDAIAAGLNALGEELDFAFQTRKTYSDELEKTNRQLVESKEKIQAIFDNAPDAIIATDSNFKITEWNKAAEKMYGYLREEVLGKQSEDIIHTRHASPISREQARNQLRERGTWSGEVIQSTKRKSDMVVLCSSSFLKHENGLPLGFLGVNRDLTQLIQTKEKLKDSEARYHMLINEIADYAIIMLDQEGNITSWNKGAEHIKGYTEQEVLGKHFSIFYREEDKKKKIPESNLEEVRKLGKFSTVGWRIRKNRTPFWADVIMTELVDAEGNRKGFVKITKDLSDRRKFEEELKQKSEELKRSNTELEQFAYVASHDLQEPLRMITSYVQLLEKNYKDKLDDDAHDFINFAVDGANRMQTLIYSLLEFSRINRVKPFETIDLDDTLKEVEKDLELAIQETKTTITWDTLPAIYGDKILIGQLLMNLISNAIKFRSDQSPVINISCIPKAGKYLFTVADNGIGIKKEYSEKIFVIFQRLHSKDKYPGTGIGLAICKKIVERHGGSIWVEPNDNGGSKFCFTIKK